MNDQHDNEQTDREMLERIAAIGRAAWEGRAADHAPAVRRVASTPADLDLLRKTIAEAPAVHAGPTCDDT